MAGLENVVTLDIGGTSADIGVAAGGELRMRHLLDTKVGDYQAMVPMVDIDTIGAGGGSIAYVDEGGVFRVGPQSAGADPGPGLLRPRRHGADLDRRATSCSGGCGPTAACWAATCGSTSTSRARPWQRSPASSGMSVEEAALGALQIQKFGMTQAIELNSVRRGYDPRDFTLVPGGGAGGLFACDIALELEIPRVLVPAHPGIIAATGLLATDLQHEYVATERHALRTLDRERLERRFAELAGAGRRAARRRRRARGAARWCAASPTAATPARATRCASTCPPGAIDDAWVEGLAEGFHAAHEAEYGQRFDAAIEIINMRVVGIGRDRRAAAGASSSRATATPRGR